MTVGEKQIAISVKFSIEVSPHQHGLWVMFQKEPINNEHEVNVVKMLPTDDKDQVSQEDLQQAVKDSCNEYLFMTNIESFLNGVDYKINIINAKAMTVH